MGGIRPRLLALEVEDPVVAAMMSPGALRVAVSATARRSGISGEHAEAGARVVVGDERRGDGMLREGRHIGYQEGAPGLLN